MTVRWTSEPPPRSAWTLVQWEASAIDGRVVMRTTDLPTAIRQAQTFGAPASIDPATAAGMIEIDATLDGTLAAVRSTGRITGRSVTLAGLPSSDLDVSFEVDMAGKTSTGTFRLLAPELSSSTLASQSGLALGGSLTATGSWSGPLTAPIVDASATGSDLTVVRGGSVAVTASGGALDVTLKGPIDDLGGEGKLTIGISANRRARGRRGQRGPRAGRGQRPRTRASAQRQRGPRCLDWSRGTEHLRGPGDGCRLRHPRAWRADGSGRRRCERTARDGLELDFVQGRSAGRDINGG